MAISGERGAGSILAVAVLAAIVGAVILVAPLAHALVLRAAMLGAADAAALAAADVARGISPGVPCVIAASVAHANGALLTDCLVDGDIVTVRVSTSVLGLPVAVAATAGPPVTGK
ncbi:MAG: Rv3654c family TadE-like protein [Terrimesophilobacter sp.]